jgi:aryl-alcohol dehydrogenase-like predicted oxidoreductase
MIKEMRMDYRTLGRTGVKVSPLCLGTMNFGARTDAATAIRMIDRAIDQGINVIDTANVYGMTGEGDQGVGEAETIIGKALRQNGKRHRIVLATKVFGSMDASDPNAGGLSRRHIIQAVEHSLRRLQTDHIDLYQLHRPQLDVPLDETLRALDDLIRAGKVRYIGTSFFAPWHIVESLWVSQSLSLSRFISEQSPYSMVTREIERHLVPMARRHEMAILAFSPLDGGLLTDRYHRDREFPESSRFGSPTWGSFYGSGLNDDVWDFLDYVREMAATKGCTTSQLALAWVAQQPGITSVIIGPRTPKQLEDNLGCLPVAFTKDELVEIDQRSCPGGTLLTRS